MDWDRFSLLLIKIGFVITIAAVLWWAITSVRLKIE